MTKLLLAFVFACSVGCYERHSIDDSSDGGVLDATAVVERDPGRCTPRVLTASEMLDVPFRVQRANCSNRIDTNLMVRFIGRSAGRVDVWGDEWANYVEVRPPEFRRSYCWFSSESRYVVSRRAGLEVALQCDDGVERRVHLRLLDQCGELEALISVSNPEPLARGSEGWMGGCSDWDWSRGS